MISPSGGCINLVCLQSVRVYPNRFIQLDFFVMRFFGEILAKYCTIFDEKPQKLGVFQNLPMKKLVVLVCSPSRARLNAFF